MERQRIESVSGGMRIQGHPGVRASLAVGTFLGNKVRYDRCTEINRNRRSTLGQRTTDRDGVQSTRDIYRNGCTADISRGTRETDARQLKARIVIACGFGRPNYEA